MDKTFWKRPAGKVAKDLLGRTLVVGRDEATILEAKGFPPESNDGIYAPVRDMPPGGVYCPRQRNSILLLIATEGGGCVLIRAAEVGGQVYDGPGKLTERLGLEARVSGQTNWFDDDTISIQLVGQAAPTKRDRPKPQRSGKGISQEVLRRYMPEIAKAYLKLPPSQRPGFELFINGLLVTCNSEAELKQVLRQPKK